jgi:hypothetical protein
VRNNERHLAFYPAVSEAFLEISDPRTQFLVHYLVLVVVVAVILNLIYVSAYNNKPIKKLAHFKTFKIRMIRLRLARS